MADVHITKLIAMMTGQVNKDRVWKWEHGSEEDNERDGNNGKEKDEIKSKVYCYVVVMAEEI